MFLSPQEDINHHQDKDRVYDALPTPCWNADWIDLVQAITATVYLQLHVMFRREHGI